MQTPFERLFSEKLNIFIKPNRTNSRIPNIGYWERRVRDTLCRKHLGMFELAEFQLGREAICLRARLQQAAARRRDPARYIHIDPELLRRYEIG